MTIDNRAALDARLATLETLLGEALEQGRASDFDGPSAEALVRTRELLDSFARTFEDVSPFEVAVAVDGAVEITALLGNYFLTADVSPVGQKVEAILDETASGAVAWSSGNTTGAEILREIERAA